MNDNINDLYGDTVEKEEDNLFGWEIISEVDNDGKGYMTTVEHDITINPGHHYRVRCQYDTVHHEEEIEFQNGPLSENPVNGITSESLLTVLIHRTEVLNSNFPSEDNVKAIEHLKAALDAFNERTRKRIARGVEGKNVK